VTGNSKMSERDGTVALGERLFCADLKQKDPILVGVFADECREDSHKNDSQIKTKGPIL
jgi:hypothetical protein